MRFVFCLVLLLIAAPAFAQESLDNLPVPRWAALASKEANLRTGPGKRYPIDWVLSKKGLPVEIVQEFEYWRRVREPDGATGWVHKSMLTGMRKAMVQKREQILYANPDKDSRVIAKLERGVIGAIDACQKDWCEIELDRFKGWVPKKALWGVYPDEVIE